MSVIVNKIPDNCVECPLSYWDYYFSDLPLRCNLMSDHIEVTKSKRHEDCPLKSVDVLIEKIDKKANSGQWSESVTYGMQKAIAIIKEYCGMEEVK